MCLHFAKYHHVQTYTSISKQIQITGRFPLFQYPALMEKLLSQGIEWIAMANMFQIPIDVVMGLHARNSLGWNLACQCLNLLHACICVTTTILLNQIYSDRWCALIQLWIIYWWIPDFNCCKLFSFSLISLFLAGSKAKK